MISQNKGKKAICKGEPAHSKTVQMNIRITHELAAALQDIADHYKVDRAEWVKIKLAESALQARAEILRREM